MASPEQELSKKSLYSTRQQLIILNQINTILSSLIHTEQVVCSLLYILLIHEFFSFSQIYVFSVSDREGSVQGEYCLGYRTIEEKKKALTKIKAEKEKLQEEMKEQSSGTAYTVEQLLLHELMDMSAYICHTRIDKRHASLYSNRDLTLFSRPYLRSQDTVFNKVIKTQAMSIVTESDVYQKNGFQDLLPPPPLLFIPLSARNKVFKVIVASKCLEKKPEFEQIELALIEWILKRLSFIFENCQRYEDLEQAYQKLQEIDEIKTNFISMISHELQTPLIDIIGYSHLLSDSKLGEVNTRQKESLHKIIQKSDQLYEQIRQILFRIRLDSGDVWNEEHQKVVLRSVFEEILRYYQQKKYDKEVKFRLTVPRKKIELYLRPQMIKYMMAVLVGNAVKFSGSSVEIEIKVWVASDQTLHIEVKDDGIGISQREQEAIFQPFYQVQNPLKREYPGLGIGLSTLNELVRSLEGRLFVKSTPGKGSIFEIILPVEPASKSGA